ncbi:MAG TPA: hypothetical protein PLI09_23745 [Candidatus Hydrogenedentes bacterium]|nr:hypothetical protein [Candidatus Hydrogenedentota bacterium]
MKRLSCILILAGVAIAVSASALDVPPRINTMIQEVYRQDAVYENALYMYLRIAGIFWIAVEWIAAIVLWRAYRLLRNAAKPKGSLS